jgi:hypothetical protein
MASPQSAQLSPVGLNFSSLFLVGFQAIQKSDDVKSEKLEESQNMLLAFQILERPN